MEDLMKLYQENIDYYTKEIAWINDELKFEREYGFDTSVFLRIRRRYYRMRDKYRRKLAELVK